MPGIGSIRGWELILILAIVMIIFGVGRLPEVGSALGKAIRQFRQTVSGTAEAESEPEAQAESDAEETETSAT